VSQVAGKGQGKIGGATAHIEEACCRRYAAAGYCLLAPVVVQPKAQYGVEQVIMRGDSGKHLPHGFSHSFFAFSASIRYLLARPRALQYYGHHRMHIATPQQSGRSLLALNQCKADHTVARHRMEEALWTQDFYMVLVFYENAGGMVRAEKR
jgi:hypothetical protein